MKNNIRLHRVIEGYSQEQLANLADVSRQTINALEAAKYVPSTVLALRLSKIPEKSVEDLFELEEGE